MKTNNDEKRERILSVARDSFARYGYKKTSMDEIAGAARVGKGTIYLYYKDKEGLFFSVILREAERLREQVMRAVDKKSTAVEKVEGMFHGVLESLQENPFLDRILARDTEIIAKHLIPLIRQVEDAAVLMIQEILVQGMEEGTIRPLDPKLAAYTLYKIYQSFGYARTLDDKDFNIKKIKEFVTEFVRRGIENAE